MKKQKQISETVFDWLAENGFTRLGGMTGQDYPALKAAAHVIELWSCADSNGRRYAAAAFGAIVRTIQPQYRCLAYHAIAHVCDWSDRDQLWVAAGLEPLSNPGVCSWEPGGSERPPANSPRQRLAAQERETENRAG